MKGGKNAASKEASRARREEEARQGRIRQGMDRVDDTFSQFDDDFFGQRRQSFLDFATPQLEDQFQDATKQLTFALARSGNLNSSTRGEQASELEKLYEQRRQEIADQAIDYETRARDDVEGARGEIIRTLNSTADAEAASNAALARASSLTQQPAYSPLADLFASFTSALGTQARFERAGAIDPAAGGRYNTGLFAPSSRSVEIKE